MQNRQGGRRIEDRGGQGKFAIRAPKNSVHLAFCIAYVGSSFRGLQLQAHEPTHHTVEGVFIQALQRAGVIHSIQGGRIADKTHFLGRSCRTDRGVHAVRNVVSLFIPAERFVSMFAEAPHRIAERVNEQLPPPIRVLAVTRVMGTFSSKNCCNRRVYRYYLPIYALLGCDTWASFFTKFPDAAQELLARGNSTRELSDAADLEGSNSREISLDSMRGANGVEGHQVGWLASVRDVVEKLNAEVTCKLVGSHRFHNFSVDTDVNGRVNAKCISSLSDESVRVITRCEIVRRVRLLPTAQLGPSNCWLQSLLQAVELASVPTTETVATVDSSEADLVVATAQTVQAHVASATVATAPPPQSLSLGATAQDAPRSPALPFVIFQVEGASFLLNMIRKMVGVVIAVARGARTSLVDELLLPTCRFNVPLAPGPYLSLALSTYQGYDFVTRDVRERREASRAAADERRRRARLNETPDAFTDVGATDAQLSMPQSGPQKDPVVEKRTSRAAALTSSTSSYPPLEESWNDDFGVEGSAARFFAEFVEPEIVDADLNRMVPLDTALFLRDAARRRSPATAERDAAQDSHLQTMKEYAPSKPVARLPAASEMTVFVRMLRVHNWNKRLVEVPPGSKVANEMANAAGVRKRPRVEGVSDDPQASELLAPDEPAEDEPRCAVDPSTTSVAEVDEALESRYPYAHTYDDGWIYGGRTAEEERQLRRAVAVERYFNTRRMRRIAGKSPAAAVAGATVAMSDPQASDGVVTSDDTRLHLVDDDSNIGTEEDDTEAFLLLGEPGLAVGDE